MVQKLRSALIKLFLSSKLLFVWHLTKRIKRMDRAGKGAGIHWKKSSRDWLENDQWESVTISAWSLSCTLIFFCRLKAGLEVFMKVASRADRWKGERPRVRIENRCWSSSNAFVSGAEGLRFKSEAGQIQHNVVNGSPPLRHLIFRKKLCCRGQWRRDGLHQLVTRFGVIQRV